MGGIGMNTQDQGKYPKMSKTIIVCISMIIRNSQYISMVCSQNITFCCLMLKSEEFELLKFKHKTLKQITNIPI